MELRRNSQRRRPGRYCEDDGPIDADRPIFVHEDALFNADLARHCAFPSLPMNHPGPGPSTARLAAERAAAAEFTLRPLNKPPPQLGETSQEQPLRDAGKAAEETGPKTITPPPDISAETRVGPKSPAAAAVHTVGAAQRTENNNGRDRGATRKPATPLRKAGATRRASVVTLPRVAPTPKGPVALTSMYQVHIPQWPNLPDAVKYIIIKEMTDRTTFTRAIRELSLDSSDISDLIQLIRDENKKRKSYEQLVGIYHHQRASFAEAGHPFPDELITNLLLRTYYASVTQRITANQIQQGVVLLNFLGFPDVAARLGGYQGTARAKFYEVPLTHFVEDGDDGLPVDFKVAFADMLELRSSEVEAAAEPPPDGSVWQEPPPGPVARPPLGTVDPGHLHGPTPQYMDPVPQIPAPVSLLPSGALASPKRKHRDSALPTTAARLVPGAQPVPNPQPPARQAPTPGPSAVVSRSRVVAEMESRRSATEIASIRAQGTPATAKEQSAAIPNPGTANKGMIDDVPAHRDQQEIAEEQPATIAPPTSSGAKNLLLAAHVAQRAVAERAEGSRPSSVSTDLPSIEDLHPQGDGSQAVMGSQRLESRDAAASTLTKNTQGQDQAANRRSSQASQASALSPDSAEAYIAHMKRELATPSKRKRPRPDSEEDDEDYVEEAPTKKRKVPSTPGSSRPSPREVPTLQGQNRGSGGANAGAPIAQSVIAPAAGPARISKEGMGPGRGGNKPQKLVLKAQRPLVPTPVSGSAGNEERAKNGTKESGAQPLPPSTMPMTPKHVKLLPSSPAAAAGPATALSSPVVTPVSYWSSHERFIFPGMVASLGRNWGEIARRFGKKTPAQVEKHFDRCCAEQAYATDNLKVTAAELVAMADRADAAIARGDAMPQPPVVDPNARWQKFKNL